MAFSSSAKKQVDESCGIFFRGLFNGDPSFWGGIKLDAKFGTVILRDSLINGALLGLVISARV